MTTFSDTFDRADNTDLGANWDSGYTGVTNSQIVGNKIRTGTLGNRGEESYNGATFLDAYARLTLSTFTGAGYGDVSLGVRAVAPATREYYAVGAIKNNAPATTQLIKRIAGVATSLAEDLTQTWVANDTMTLTCQLRTLEVYRNSTVFIRLQDSAITAAGRLLIGPREDGTIADVEADNFIGGDYFEFIGSGPILAPSLGSLDTMWW